MAMTEDMGDFFDDNEFSVVALWKGTTSVNVIFDNEYTEQFGAAGSNPFITAPAESFNGIAKGQTLLLESKNYTIKTFEPDGTGILRIELLKA
jgi:hypothetical protein